MSLACRHCTPESLKTSKVPPPFTDEDHYYDHLEQDHGMIVKRGPLYAVDQSGTRVVVKERESTAQAKRRIEKDAQFYNTKVANPNATD